MNKIFQSGQILTASELNAIVQAITTNEGAIADIDISGLQSTIEQAQADITALSTEFANANLASLKTQLEAANTTIEEAKAEIEAAKKSIDDAKAALDALLGDEGDAGIDIEETIGKITVFAKWYDQNGQYVTNYESVVDTIRGLEERAFNKIDALDDTVTTYKNTVDVNNAKVTEYIGKVDVVENRVSSCETTLDAAAGWSAASTWVEGNKSAIGTLTASAEKITGLVSHYNDGKLDSSVVTIDEAGIITTVTSNVLNSSTISSMQSNIQLNADNISLLVQGGHYEDDTWVPDVTPAAIVAAITEKDDNGNTVLNSQITISADLILLLGEVLADFIYSNEIYTNKLTLVGTDSMVTLTPDELIKYAKLDGTVDDGIHGNFCRIYSTWMNGYTDNSQGTDPVIIRTLKLDGVLNLKITVYEDSWMNTESEGGVDCIYHTYLTDRCDYIDLTDILISANILPRDQVQFNASSLITSPVLVYGGDRNGSLNAKFVNKTSGGTTRVCLAVGKASTGVTSVPVGTYTFDIDIYDNSKFLNFNVPTETTDNGYIDLGLPSGTKWMYQYMSDESDSENIRYKTFDPTNVDSVSSFMSQLSSDQKIPTQQLIVELIDNCKWSTSSFVTQTSLGTVINATYLAGHSKHNGQHIIVASKVQCGNYEDNYTPYMYCVSDDDQLSCGIFTINDDGSASVVFARVNNVNKCYIHLVNN